MTSGYLYNEFTFSNTTEGKKDWSDSQYGVNHGVYTFCFYEPSPGWCQTLESIIYSSKFQQDITPRDADTGVLAPPTESEFTFGQSPLVSPVRLYNAKPHCIDVAPSLTWLPTSTNKAHWKDLRRWARTPAFGLWPREDAFLHKLWSQVPGTTPVHTIDWPPWNFKHKGMVNLPRQRLGKEPISQFCGHGIQDPFIILAMTARSRALDGTHQGWTHVLVSLCWSLLSLIIESALLPLAPTVYPWLEGLRVLRAVPWVEMDQPESIPYEIFWV